MISSKAQQLFLELSLDENGYNKSVKLGDIKKSAKVIKRDHDLALEPWNTGSLIPRLIAILIFNKKLIDQTFIDSLCEDISAHGTDERNQLTDWLLANQCMKDKKLIAMMLTWQDAVSPIQRRLFWYYQARLRWTGQTPPDNTATLLNAIEQNLSKEHPDVQWAMNFCTGQIGVHQSEYRTRCIKIGKELGLYKDDHVSRNCTPSYLPEFIKIEVSKRE